ncbi:MAG: dephospho-CoA kinase [Planctomycetota bacterium]
MEKSNKKPVIGIVGGIGSGKSTVSNEFVKLGCGLVDADKIAHKALDNARIKERIVKLFGNTILDSGGKVDRSKVGKIVFSDSSNLSALNKIIHPFVLAKSQALIEKYNRQESVKAIVLDMPLLAEVGWAERCERVVFVDCPEQIRLQRIKKKPYFDENELKIRENSQISLDNKARLADNIVYNSSDFSALARQVADIFISILNR